jgi:hypothetical protein
MGSEEFLNQMVKAFLGIITDRCPKGTPYKRES